MIEKGSQSVFDVLANAPDSYHEAEKSFVLPHPDFYNFAIDMFDEFAKRQPNELAMIWVPAPQVNNTEPAVRPQENITYRQMSDQAHIAASALSRLGIKKGDRVMIMLPRIPGKRYIHKDKLKKLLLLSSSHQ